MSKPTQDAKDLFQGSDPLTVDEAVEVLCWLARLSSKGYYAQHFRRILERTLCGALPQEPSA